MTTDPIAAKAKAQGTMTDNLKRYIVEYVANGQSLDSPVVYTDQIMAYSHDEAVRRSVKDISYNKNVAGKKPLRLGRAIQAEDTQ